MKENLWLYFFKNNQPTYFNRDKVTASIQISDQEKKEEEFGDDISLDGDIGSYICYESCYDYMLSVSMFVSISFILWKRFF